MYESLVSYLVNPNAHDFRLTELPALLGRDEFLTISRRILDVGCGPGTLVWRALDLGHDAYGVDLSEEKVGLAQMWAEVSGRERWRDRVEIRDAGALTYASESFDLVTSYHVLEHVADLPSVLFEAVRVTKRGGWLELRAPDYRMSYDTHYCMPWPRFMPPAQAAEWCRAMGRPTGGIGTFFYITGPQVVALLTALGCRIETLIYREHRDSQVHLSTEHITADPIIFDSTRDVSAFAAELQSLAAAGRLPDMYKTCLEFTIAAQRL
ncbi:MAG TPA: class I SAM-dependent methyltransferase [Candidatus Baltobacteraceae bacterium]|nr:class I SAM-dependent methyltransferase [Candidatus Baltobacteraceae bacterium]